MTHDRRARPPPPLAPVHPAARLGGGGAARRSSAAEGTDLIDTDGRRYIDGTSSLWCNVHGHRHPHDRRGDPRPARPGRPLDDARPHPRPGAELAERLAAIAPPGLDRVFYSDAGSTAIEIALKMAFQYWQQRGGQHVLPDRLRRTSPTPTTATRSGPSRSAASTSSTRPTSRCCSAPTRSTPATSRGSRADPRLPRRGDRRGDRRAAGPGRGRDPRPAARLPARASASSATSTTSC